MYTVPAGMFTVNGIFNRVLFAIPIVANMMCIGCIVHNPLFSASLDATNSHSHTRSQQVHTGIVQQVIDSNWHCLFQNHLLEVDAKKAAGPTWETVRYMVSEIQYGGRITDDFDQLLMDTYAEKYFHQEVTRPNFELYKDERAGISYKIPDSGEIEGFRKVAEAFTHITPIIWLMTVC